MSGEMTPHAAPATKSIELADILIRHAGAFFSRFRPALRYMKVAQRIMACRTSALGGHLKSCDDCDYRKYVYHSCRNRHCPKCQSQAKEAWREARQLDLLPVPYFHQVFTLPHELNEWILASDENQRALLKLLFDSASATLSEFGRGELGGQIGFTLVLHTWDQQLRPHFHLHGLVASGALAPDGSHWIAGGNRFLFPVRALSKKFRGKFIDGFKRLLDRGELRLPGAYADGSKETRAMIKKLRKKAWVVYSKRPFPDTGASMTAARFFRQEVLPGSRCALASWFRGCAGVLGAAEGPAVALTEQTRGRTGISTGWPCLCSAVRPW